MSGALRYTPHSGVYVPYKKDDTVKEYLRMRDDHNSALKRVKQQISEFVMRPGKQDIGRWERSLEKNLFKMASAAGPHEAGNETLHEYLFRRKNAEKMSEG